MFSVLRAVCLGIVTAAASSAQAATVTAIPSADGQIVISLAGEIMLGDADRVARMVQGSIKAGRRVSGIRLSSPGGSLREGVVLGLLLKETKIASVVANGATCASACFIAFAGPSEKFASHAARVGVHGASVNGQDSAGGTVGMAKVLRELGVPPGIIGKMVVTPSSEMVWLSPDELRSMNVTMTGQARATPDDATPRQQLQIAPATPDWSAVMNKAYEASQGQNAGRARFSRGCQPEHKVCSTAIFFKGQDGNESMVRQVENISGFIISKDVCHFNAFNDIRTCKDFDTKITTQEMKDTKGEWKLVSE